MRSHACELAQARARPTRCWRRACALAAARVGRAPPGAKPRFSSTTKSSGCDPQRARPAARRARPAADRAHSARQALGIHRGTTSTVACASEAFATPDEAELLGGRRLDVDTAPARPRAALRCRARIASRCGPIRGASASTVMSALTTRQPASASIVTTASTKPRAGGAAPARIGIREMHADVAEPAAPSSASHSACRTTSPSECATHAMIMRNAHAAQHHVIARPESMHVDARADSHAGPDVPAPTPRRAASIAATSVEIRRRRDLDFVGEAGHQPRPHRDPPIRWPAPRRSGRGRRGPAPAPRAARRSGTPGASVRATGPRAARSTHRHRPPACAALQRIRQRQREQATVGMSAIAGSSRRRSRRDSTHGPRRVVHHHPGRPRRAPRAPPGHSHRIAALGATGWPRPPAATRRAAAAARPPGVVRRQRDHEAAQRASRRKRGAAHARAGCAVDSRYCLGRLAPSRCPAGRRHDQPVRATLSGARAVRVRGRQRGPAPADGVRHDLKEGLVAGDHAELAARALFEGVMPFLRSATSAASCWLRCANSSFAARCACTSTLQPRDLADAVVRQPEPVLQQHRRDDQDGSEPLHGWSRLA